MGGSARYRYMKKVARINADTSLSDWERDTMLQDADMVYQEQSRREQERKAAKSNIKTTKRSEKLEQYMNASDWDKYVTIATADIRMDELPKSLQYPPGVESLTQKIVYALELNDKPTILSSKEFDEYLKSNNVRDENILSRSVNADTVFSLENWMHEDLNYISGRVGGSANGEGQYFAYNFGKPTGYGGTNPKTIRAVFKPDAKIATKDDLMQAFNDMPEDVRVYIGGNIYQNPSVVALLAGYDAISIGNYVTVINRSAVIVDENIF